MAEDKKTEFGASLRTVLIRSGLRQSALAQATGYSRSHVNHILAGRKAASPDWINLVADWLQLLPEDRAALHRTAALDAGFELDLSRPVTGRRDPEPVATSASASRPRTS